MQIPGMQEPELERMTRRFGLPSAAAIALVLGGVAWFSQPTLQYMDPDLLAGAALLLFIGGIVLYATIILGSRRIWLVFSLLVFVVGLGLLFWTWIDGLDNAHRNEKRCAAIERDMVSQSPRREDGPALFLALGCRPLTDAVVAFPAAEAGH